MKTVSQLLAKLKSAVLYAAGKMETKTVNTLISELKRTILSPYFLACVILMAVMCFTSPGYMDYSTNKQYTIFEMMFMLGTEKAQSYDFAWQTVITMGFGVWMAQFLVILVSFPFVKIMCDERLYGQKRYYISRTGIFRYSISKLLSAVVSAALICLLGYLVFSVASMIVFPSINTFSASEQETLDMMHMSYTQNLIRVVLIGASFVPLPFIIAAFTRNLYFSVCIPFLVQYMHRTAENKIMSGIYTSGGLSEKKQILLQLSTHNSAGLIATAEANYALYAAMLHAVIFAAAFLVFYIVQKRRVDNGT